MNPRFRLLFFILLALTGILILSFLTQGHTFAVLEPKGLIAFKERSLMITAALLMSGVVLWVFILTACIAWKYRASNTQATYTPDWDHHLALESIWWGLPCVIILILAIITWNSAHQLDPFKPINSSTPPITIQVVALQWKWLFIYPAQHIASVNYLQFPANTPVNFQITADAPMNSFWIPQLGGQVYAMPGMSTQLHLMADAPGSYNGSSANISGAGFADMRFIAKSSSEADFNQWVQTVQASSNPLDLQRYQVLATPADTPQPVFFSSTNPDLYDTVVMKFMMPGMSGMDMNKTSPIQ